MGQHSFLISVCGETPVDGVEAGLLLCVFVLSPCLQRRQNCREMQNHFIKNTRCPFSKLKAACCCGHIFVYLYHLHLELCKSSGEWDEHLKPGEGGSIWKYKTCPVQLHVLPPTRAVTRSWPVLCSALPPLYFFFQLSLLSLFLYPIKLGGGGVGERNKTDGYNGAKSCPAVFSAAISLTIPRK